MVPKEVNMKKESRLNLNMGVLGHTHTAMMGFLVAGFTMLGAGSVIDGVQNVKDANEFRAAGEFDREDKKDLAGTLAFDTFLLVVAFAVVWTATKSLGNIKRQNDEKGIEFARRYLEQMRKTNPELAKYDYVLLNDSALSNIAAGLMNFFPVSEAFDLGCDWEKRTETVIKALKKYAEKDPQFMSQLVKLVDNSAKTFSLKQYMATQGKNGR